MLRTLKPQESVVKEMKYLREAIHEIFLTGVNDKRQFLQVTFTSK